MQFVMLAGALALLGQSQPGPGELKQRLNSEIKATFETNKKSYDLEVCLADALTLIGGPTVLRNGPENIIIAVAYGGGNAIFATINVDRTPTGSHLELRARGNGWDDRLKARITTCL